MTKLIPSLGFSGLEGGETSIRICKNSCQSSVNGHLAQWCRQGSTDIMQQVQRWCWLEGFLDWIQRLGRRVLPEGNKSHEPIFTASRYVSAQRLWFHLVGIGSVWPAWPRHATHETLSGFQPRYTEGTIQVLSYAAALKSHGADDDYDEDNIYSRI